MRKFGRATLIIVFFLLAAAILAPIGYMLTGALQSSREVAYTAANAAYTPPKLLPERISFEQFRAALVDDPEIYGYFWNTIALVVPIVAGGVMVSTLGAYGFAKFRFPGRRAAYFAFVFLVMLPYQIMLSPQYILLREAGMIGSRLAVILPMLSAPVGLFLMTGFMRAVSDETLEAARMEGAREVQVFWHVALPQVTPGVSLLAIFLLVENWNLVEQPLVLLNDSLKDPLSVALSYIGSARPEMIYACAVFFMIPVLLCFALGVRRIIRNLGKLWGDI